MEKYTKIMRDTGDAMHNALNDDQTICVAIWSVDLFLVLDTEGKCSNAEAQLSKILLSMIHVE